MTFCMVELKHSKVISLRKFIKPSQLAPRNRLEWNIWSYGVKTRNEIHLSTSGYGHSLKEFDLGDTGTNRDRPLLPTEKTCLKQLSGQINWIATHSRPDCAFDNCTVANSIKEACVQDLHTENKVIRKVKGQEVALLFPTNFDHTACRIVTFTDASFADLPDMGSQGAYVTFLCDKYGSFCLLAWQSRRIRRVVRPSPVDYCEDYHLIPKCHYFENLRLCRSISLLWLCPVFPGIPLLGISWYLSIFIVSQNSYFFILSAKLFSYIKCQRRD